MTSTVKPTKRERRLGIRVIPKLDKYVTRRPYPPGKAGSRRRQGQLSDYGIQLQEKQRIKFTYGLRERQLRRLFGINQDSILVTLERRLDNVVYRSGLAKSRAQARQQILHGRVKVNDKKLTVPSALVVGGQKIEPKHPETIEINQQELPTWMELNTKTKIVTIKRVPVREDITSEINEQLIKEYYSR